jgi:hypothetical protein
LTHASDEYRILTDDTERYKLVVTECKLHVPIGVIHPAEWYVRNIVMEIEADRV